MAGIEQLSAFTQLDGGNFNVLLMLCFATLLAWSNGANDIANSVGTVSKCRRTACVCVCVCVRASCRAFVPSHE